TGMVRRVVWGEVQDWGVRVPLRRSVGHRARRTPRSCRFTAWTRAFGPCPIGVHEPWSRSRTARSALIWEIPADPAGANPRAGRGVCRATAIAPAVVGPERSPRGPGTEHEPPPAGLARRRPPDPGRLRRPGGGRASQRLRRLYRGRRGRGGG